MGTHISFPRQTLPTKALIHSNSDNDEIPDTGPQASTSSTIGTLFSKYKNYTAK